MISLNISVADTAAEVVIRRASRRRSAAAQGLYLCWPADRTDDDRLVRSASIDLDPPFLETSPLFATGETHESHPPHYPRRRGHTTAARIECQPRRRRSNAGEGDPRRGRASGRGRACRAAPSLTAGKAERRPPRTTTPPKSSRRAARYPPASGTAPATASAGERGK